MEQPGSNDLSYSISLCTSERTFQKKRLFVSLSFFRVPTICPRKGVGFWEVRNCFRVTGNSETDQEPAISPDGAPMYSSVNPWPRHRWQLRQSLTTLRNHCRMNQLRSGKII
jgi:hypothetical protein